jgi:hypothetical protein
LREPDFSPRLAGDVIIGSNTGRYTNSLNGSSRGIELVVNRESATGLSGWAAYCFGKTRYTDVDRDQTYWADFDQRHALTIAGTYRISTRTNVGATLRASSNVPIPAYLTARDGSLFLGPARNEVRLPAYVRLDVRADRGFESFGRRLTVFVEVLNVLNRTNLGPARGWIRPSTGEAVGFTDTLFPRRASAGLLIKF